MAELAVLALTSAGVSAGTAATIGTVVSVGMTAASAFSSIQAGKAESNALKVQARQAGVNARLERLEGRRQAGAIQDQLEKDLASQNAIFAARGSLQGEGSAAAAAAAANNNATRDINLALFNSEIGALNAEQRASNNRADAKAARSKGFKDALSTVGSFKPFPKTPTGSGGGSGVPIPQRKPSLLSGLA